MLDHQTRVWYDQTHAEMKTIHHTPATHVRHMSYPTPPTQARHMSYTTPPPTVPSRTPSVRSSHQDFQWLGELQSHTSDYEYLKPLLRDRRLELQQRQAQLNFWTREIQDRQKQVRDSNFSSGAQRRELQIQLQTLLRDREVARQDYQRQQAEFERLSRQIQSHREIIDNLMQRLRIIVSS
ncbi:hypothetical protein M406DRAFT_74618 [Cryphonectria parasitica EP155]|uniref:Uncharacterized protein n=1 Tax=Cryphonectria parasitica (strain ATCC 38755 / EP155) TaxID=660469 RepID=A0A9P4XVB6_CRYP1|nr:uncharacterized protein M406DRAFT_74618 [Cryphonectria parasitica EP155]KAF3761668.1 hypothetical protein M406DRAFT_74618 [Cryphonectria parasitica EP155]